MNRSARWTLMIVGLLCITNLFVGCGGVKDKIVGKWAEPTQSYDNIYEFFEDGSLVVTTAFGGENMTYQVLDDGRVKINFRGLFGGNRTVIYEVKFEDGGDTLILLGENGSRMRRIKE